MNIAGELKRGTYSFTINKKLEVFTVRKKSKRISSFISLRDKIVQKAIQLLLNEIYEKKEKVFSAHSYGFRIRKGCHSALEEIKKT